MNLPEHLKTSRSAIKEAKFNNKLSKKNEHNHKTQRESFINRLAHVFANETPDMDLKIIIKEQ